ncbi:MAG: NCS2 family permease [Treponema sp.]|nr:NCS2 family permease [Treponema sp.]
MEKFFKLSERGTNARTEAVAGITTFLAMAYILAVNPALLSQTGMDAGGVFTATALASAIATLVMAFAANLPVALAPGMGLNAFFTYTVVMGMGYSWQTALTAVFLEGILFIVLSLLKVREALIKAIPLNIKKAVAVGIGLFITLIGLVDGGIVSSETGTIIGFVQLKGTALVAIIGLVSTIVLICLKVKGAIIIGMILTTLAGIPFGVTHVPENFSPFSLPAAPLFWKFDFSNIFTLKFFVVFFTFLFVDMFDTLGTLMGVAEQSNLKDKNGDIKNVNQALLADAVGTVAGAMLGTSTVTSFVESTAGIAEGGRTGLTSLTTALMFLVALFLSPLFLLVPSAASAPALIIVGSMMMSAASGIDFKDLSEGIPAFITIMTMPFAYSIATGISWGIMSYVVCKVASRKFKDISIITWILCMVFVAKTVLDAV